MMARAGVLVPSANLRPGIGSACHFAGRQLTSRFSRRVCAVSMSKEVNH